MRRRKKPLVNVLGIDVEELPAEYGEYKSVIYVDVVVTTWRWHDVKMETDMALIGEKDVLDVLRTETETAIARRRLVTLYAFTTFPKSEIKAVRVEVRAKINGARLKHSKWWVSSWMYAMLCWRGMLKYFRSRKRKR